MDSSGTAAIRPAQLALHMLTPRAVARRGGLWIEGAERLWFTLDGERVALLRVRGRHPPVLLVHGWEGASADFVDVLPALLATGHGALLLDLPAHGQSGGRTMTLPAAARAVFECGRRYGPLHAAVAHSLGAAALGEAMRAGLGVGRAVMLAPPRRYLDGVDAAVRACGYDAQARGELLAALHRHGVDAAALDLRSAVAALEVPGLIVHGEEDGVLPLAAGRSVAAAWPGCRFVAMPGLGHRHILRDARVVDEIVRFVTAPGPDAAAPAPFHSSGRSGSTYFAGGLPS